MLAVAGAAAPAAGVPGTAAAAAAGAVGAAGEASLEPVVVPLRGYRKVKLLAGRGLACFCLRMELWQHATMSVFVRFGSVFAAAVAPTTTARGSRLAGSLVRHTVQAHGRLGGHSTRVLQPSKAHQVDGSSPRALQAIVRHMTAILAQHASLIELSAVLCMLCYAGHGAAHDGLGGHPPLPLL